jgi:putative effector of murein hydrolase
MDILINTPVFGITLTLIAYFIAKKFAQRVNTPLANPIIVASLIISSVIILGKIPIANYQAGGDLLIMLILPATICLSVMVYENLSKIKQQLLPIIVGSIVGAIVSIASILFFSQFWGLPPLLQRSLLPKSVTAAIAMDLSLSLQGTLSLTIMAVMITGITGALLGPSVLRLLQIKDPVLQGLALGTSSHVIGTSKAIEMGPIQGASSSIALFCTGIITALILLFIY